MEHTVTDIRDHAAKRHPEPAFARALRLHAAAAFCADMRLCPADLGDLRAALEAVEARKRVDAAVSSAVLSLAGQPS